MLMIQQIFEQKFVFEDRFLFYTVKVKGKLNSFFYINDITLFWYKFFSDYLFWWVEYDTGLKIFITCWYRKNFDPGKSLWGFFFYSKVSMNPDITHFLHEIR